MRYIGLILPVCLVACASPTRSSEHSYFNRVWRADAANREVQSRDEYLAWVASFYEGSPVVAGWTRRQVELCASLDPAEARVAEPLIECLGRLLSSEWAKDNRHRRVNSEALATWAGVLSEARDEGRLLAALDSIIADVRYLLGQHSAVSFQRSAPR